MRHNELRPPSTTLTSFFAMCEADPFAATLMYVEMPKYYTESINKEIPTSQTRNPSSRLATDSVVSSNAYQIRTLFAIIITTCFPSQPIQLWNKYKDAICEDILHRLRIQTNNPDIQITDEIYNEGLILIEDQCLTIANKLLIEVGMIAPNRSMHDSFNQELNRELQYNVDTLQEFVRNNVPLLNEQQNKVYETLMQAVDNNTGGLFFLDAPGGTGKHLSFH
ncbi:hypothetical protein EVAR_21154_1 [Eumeta japonica]|uniref:ATP-dependent DNA helicase n=1 Tax=Eumeta variegata TaxID=151549 RepID=A0A4C1SRT1_EUMVA|nr:hypothetical protein EVAR_21154_1 [Eumeta japonica]